MKTPSLVLVAIAIITLPACASRATLPSLDGPEALHAATLDAATVARSDDSLRCGEPLPLVDGAASWTVEGFGGPDAQVFVTRRQPRSPCDVGTAGRGGRLGALR